MASKKELEKRINELEKYIDNVSSIQGELLHYLDLTAIHWRTTQTVMEPLRISGIEIKQKSICQHCGAKKET